MHLCKHLQMEPDGDPEARIRDLERRLAEQAHSSELGTRPYASASSADWSADVPAPPHSYSPQPAHQQTGYQYGSPHYDSPYYQPPQRVVHKRARALRLIPLVLGFVTAGIVGTIVFANLADVEAPSAPEPEAPGFAGGGGSVDAPEVDIDAPEVVVPFDPTGEVVTVGAGDTLSFGGIEQNKTVLCTQGTVNISGMTNTIEIRGDCASVSVSGMDNVITVENAESITAAGFDNRVTYRSGTPKISTSGSGNLIEAG